MKLTKTMRHDFCRKVLESIPAPEFAKMRDEIWQKIIRGRLPASVGKVYARHPHTISQDLVNKTRNAAIVDFEAGRFGNTDEAAWSAALTEIEMQEEDFKARLDKLRASVMTAVNSVTTVNGVRKLLPQYANLLPSEVKTDGAAVQEALFSIEETVKTLIPTKPRRKARK